jgi:hypothetical protein
MTEALLIAGDWIEDDTAPDNVVRMMQEDMILQRGECGAINFPAAKTRPLGD